MLGVALIAAVAFYALVKFKRAKLPPPPPAPPGGDPLTLTLTLTFTLTPKAPT